MLQFYLHPKFFKRLKKKTAYEVEIMQTRLKDKMYRLRIERKFHGLSGNYR